MVLTEFLRDFLLTASWRTGVLIGLGLALGVTINALRPASLRFERFQPAAVCTGATQPQEIRVLKPEQAARLCGDSRTLVADVRNGEAFAAGHVAGAVHIPCTGSHADVEHVRERLAGKDALVVYGDTEDQAKQVASDLAVRIERPELSVSVIAGGWRAWFDAGMACASGPCDDCEGLVSRAAK